MTEQLRNRTDLFVENIQLMKQNFKWDYGITHRMAAFLYAGEDKELDVEGIKEAKSIIKGNTGIFSAFKDSTFLIGCTLVSLHNLKEEYFKQTLEVYNRMKTAGFYGSNYLTIAALSIAKKEEVSNYDAIIKRTKEYYDRMKQEHWFLTSSDDYCFATMLGMSQLGLDSTIREIEVCYDILKGKFFSSNSVQSLCHVLAFGEEGAHIKCERVVKIYEALKSKKCKLGNDGELTSLGILALISDDVDKITDDIVEVSNYLKTQKGFDSIMSSKSERIRYAAALVSGSYVQNLKDEMLNITLANSLTNILIAQETAIIVALTASTAAVNASNN